MVDERFDFILFLPLLTSIKGALAVNGKICLGGGSPGGGKQWCYEGEQGRACGENEEMMSYITQTVLVSTTHPSLHFSLVTETHKMPVHGTMRSNSSIATVNLVCSQ